MLSVYVKSVRMNDYVHADAPLACVYMYGIFRKQYIINPLAELNEVKIMLEKLRISLIFINLVLLKSLSLNHRMHNLYTKFVRILEICKQFSNNLVNDQGNIVRCGPVPKFSDLEVVALSLAAESESIDSEKWLFDYKLQEYK